MSNKSLVPFIKGQIPASIADTNSLLIPFMEAYYEWMHLDGNNYDLLNSLSELHDIDKSLVKFTEEFQNEYLKNFPADFISDKSLTIKHINDLYKSKGTPNAVKLLIKMILGKESEIFYPSSQILRASDGEWIQENSILVKIIKGDVFDIVGESVKIATSQLTFTSVVERVRATSTPNIYEVFLERKLVYDITDNTIISYKDVVLQSLKTVTSYNIINAGKGFKVGQLFEIVSANGSGAFAKIKSTTPTGGIKALQIIKFGYGYESDFISSISATQSNANVLVQFPNLNDNIGGVLDEGTLNTVDYYAVDYADNSYVGEILASFKSGSSIDIDANSATVQFNLGNKLKYPGYYNSNRGFLSDNIYLQDSFYYQIYSYVIKIDEVIEKYKSQVESTVHPAGLKLFGEYSIKNKFELNTQLKFILSFFRLALSDSIKSLDVFSLLLTKGFQDSIPATDKYKIVFTKRLLDSILSVDTPHLTFTKGLNESISPLDTPSKTFTKRLLDSASSSDSARKTMILNKFDSIMVTDAITLGFLLDKYINDTQNVSDSGGYIYKNYYTQPDYWQSDYSEGATSF